MSENTNKSTKPLVLWYSEGPGTSKYVVGRFDTIEECEAYKRKHNSFHAVFEIEQNEVKQMSDESIKAEVEVKVGKSRIADLLCCALEGGSNYWYLITDEIKPTEFTFYSDSDETSRVPRVYPHLDFPLNPGGALIITDIEGDYEKDGVKEWRLDIAACERGLEIMAAKYPQHFSDFMAENDDAITGDVFLQCCLFGEIIFG